MSRCAAGVRVCVMAVFPVVEIHYRQGAVTMRHLAVAVFQMKSGSSSSCVGARRDLVLALTALATLPQLARAQTAGGTGPLKLIVPFTPGTGIDLIARQVGPRLAERLGRAVVVENRAGASGNLGTEAVVRAAPDGSTLLVTVNTLVMARALYPNLSFDPVRDLDPVTLTSWGQLVLVATPKSGITSAQDLIARAKARPGALNYGSPGSGTPHHLAMELMKNQAQIFVTRSE